MISIIVPVYNVKKYLLESVNSILNQTYDDLEIILVDDGSTDESGIICDNIAKRDMRVKVIHKENGGLSDARNVGISIAKGSYIGFVDSDDWIDVDMYETMLKRIEQTNADICVCGYYREFVGLTTKNYPSDNITYDYTEAITTLFRGKEFQDHAWSKLYKAELFKTIRFPVGLIYEDIRTTYRLFGECHKICTVSKPLYHYRQRKSSIVRSSFNEKQIQMLDATKEIYRDEPDKLNKYKTLLKRKELMTECFLCREMLLDNKSLKAYSVLFDQLYADIRTNWYKIITDKQSTKTAKIIASLSLFGKKCLISIFGADFVKRHLQNKYSYYQ